MIIHVYVHAIDIYRLYYNMLYILVPCCTLQRCEFEKQPKIPKKHNKGRYQLRIGSAWCCSAISLRVASRIRIWTV